MFRQFQRVALPVLAAAAVILIFLIAACGFVQLELVIAAAMQAGTFEHARFIAFIAFLFVFATGVVPCWVLRKLKVRSLIAYLLTGVVSGTLAQHCYLYANNIWFEWDFEVPEFASVVENSFRQIPATLLQMIDMQPFSAIPLIVGLVGGGIYWAFVQGYGGIVLRAAWRFVRVLVAVATVYVLLLLGVAIEAQLQLLAADDSLPILAAKLALIVGLAGFYAYPLILLSGIVPSIVLRRLQVRQLAPYLLHTPLAVAAAITAFGYNFSVAFNLGQILRKVPKNGHDTSDGMMDVAPPFSETVSDLVHSVSRAIDSFAPNSLDGLPAIAIGLTISLACGWLFWWFKVRRSRVTVSP